VTTPAQPVPAAGAKPKSESQFAKKIGPLPVWAWMGVGLVAAIGISALRGGKKNNQQAQNQQAQNQLAAQEAQLANAAYQTPPYVQQNYASSTQLAYGSSAPVSSAPAQVVVAGWPHHGQGLTPQQYVDAENALSEGQRAMGSNSTSSPQAWRPQSAHQPSAWQGARGAMRDDRGGERSERGPFSPPSRHAGPPRRPEAHQQRGRRGRR